VKHTQHQGDIVRPIRTGDVIELKTVDGPLTALVLLVDDRGEQLILDLVDGSVPVSVLRETLGEVRIFDPEHEAVIAA
jgi:hypothetical protein